MKKTALELNLSLKKTRKCEFMAQVMPWRALVDLNVRYYPEGRIGRPPFSLETMLRVHFLQRQIKVA